MKIAKPMLFSLSCLFARVPAETQDIFFYDLAQDQGLDFVHDHGGSGKKYYVETMGSGVCLLDYDNDHDLDIYFCQGSALPGWDKKIILENKLFQNDDGRWTDVTAVAGVGDKSYSTGCACGDVDNDGDTDLYVTNYVEYSLEENPWCGDKRTNRRAYCDPDIFAGSPD
ncbi:MAG TPA: VCBS repeat-containing protein, partial [Candidatus Marinimicrobia bacterium]|nr:VCBS repeat-containing protein [Candidatus Neomarinimicrobiota bacterium]